MEKKLRITVEGKAYIVTVEELEDGVESLASPAVLTHAAAPVAAAPRVAAPAAAPAAAAGTASGPGDVVAPLGGVLQSVIVAVGQSVTVGDKVAVVEAMKMNTVIVASRTGKVTKIAATVGSAVEQGQVILSIG